MYIPPTEAVPPNPYLSHLPDRDVVTTDGKHLTLINPAYMTRQVHSLGQKQFGDQGHITSLKPLNQSNTADPWETAALNLFETGSKEVIGKETINGKLYLRLMRPLVTETSCLKCHAAQGYRDGDIRGGISVSVPFSSYAATEVQQRRQLLFVHILLGSLGLLGLWKGNALLRSSAVALSQSETRYRSAYTLVRTLCDNVPDMIWAKDLEKRFLFANKAFCRSLLNAVDTDDPIGKTDMFFAERERKLHPDHPQWHTFGETCGDTDTITMEAGIPRQFDEHGNIQGKFLFLDVHKAPFLDENGKMIGTVGSARDVTIIQKMSEQLRENEERLKLALFGADLGTWDWHIPSGAIVVNERWASMLGYAMEEVEPHIRTWEALVHPDDLQCVSQAIDEHLNGKTDFYETEHRLRHKSGNWIWVLDKGRVIENDAQGKPLRACGTHFDITERKRIEDENKNLQLQLVQSQKMEAIGTLAGGIAHDFNNMLGAILGYAEIAKDASPTGSEIVKDLDRVMQAGNRAASLVKQILTFSRQTEIKHILLVPAHLVNEALKFIRPILPSTITIKPQLDTATQSILADPTQVHQIVINLCTNAFHAMEQTGGVLEITLKDCELSQHDLQSHPTVQPGSFVVLSVGDSGSGIAPEIWGKIFDPFFTTKEVGKGTGMGLSIIHGIITSHGGFIKCESNVGRGSVFQVFFPAAEKEVTSSIQPAETVLSGKEHILFIDDEEILAEMGKTMLERLGYKVTVRSNSIEALTTFQNQPDQIDVVITDQTMPGLTGIDLARRILQIREGIPIILCTGYSNLVNEEQAKAIGIKGFIMKPMSKKNIAQLLRTVLEDNLPV